jgi:hypothetical protein
VLIWGLIIGLAAAVALAIWSSVRAGRMAYQYRGQSQRVVLSIEEHIAGLRNELLQIEVLMRESPELTEIDKRNLGSRQRALQTALDHYQTAMSLQSGRNRRAA